MKERIFTLQLSVILLSIGFSEEFCSGNVCSGVNPLPVAVGKMLRLVTDLRNGYCHLVHFKSRYENLRSLAQILQEGHCFFSWDLKSGTPEVSRFRLAL